MRAIAPAKVNLYLHITGKRANGYHELDSLAVFTEFGDMLEFSAADTLSLIVHGAFASAIDTSSGNLVLRAAEALRRTANISQGAKIILTKNIPVGAGLGGGSSDAAATLIALNQFWQLNFPLKQLAEIGLPLGSDIPVCLAGKPARIRGIGEQVDPVSMPTSLWMLLVTPNKPLLTAEVYKHFKGPFSASVPSVPTDILALRPLNNDLQMPATALMPVIGDIIKAIAGTPDCKLARMSGSGAACFGLYETEQTARRAQDVIKQSQPGWWITLTKVMA